jgi:hypothetical protein
MTVRFTEVHLVGGTTHLHIAGLRAVDAVTGQRYEDTRAGWVAYIKRGNAGFVHDQYGNTIGVYVNHNAYAEWVQTYADSKWTDNLLALPKY